MNSRPSIFSEPGEAVWAVYRIWRECRRLERIGHSPSQVGTAFYERVTALFEGDSGVRRATAATASETQPLEGLLATTTPPA